MPPARRVHFPALVAGAFLLLLFCAAAAPAGSNTIPEAITLGILAVGHLAIAVAASGSLGRDWKLAGIAAEAITVLIAWGLLNNGLTAAGIYVLICQSLALAGCFLLRFGRPGAERRMRPASSRETDLIGTIAV